MYIITEVDVQCSNTKTLGHQDEGVRVLISHVGRPEIDPVQANVAHKDNRSRFPRQLILHKNLYPTH